MKKTRNPSSSTTAKFSRGKISPTRKRKALALLRRWAESRTPVHYIDKGSGLRHRGLLVDVSDEEFPSFEFMGHGGMGATILPFSWKALDVSTVASHESIHIEEPYGRSYGITVVLTGFPEARKTELKCVKAQLEMWRSSRHTLHCYLVQDGIAFAFGGTVVNVSEAGFLLEPVDSKSVIAITLTSFSCRMGKVGSIELFNRAMETRLSVSEIELNKDELVSSVLMN